MAVSPEIQALFTEQERHAQQIKRKHKAYRASIQVEEGEIRRIDSLILQIVGMGAGIDPEDLVRGYWDCPDSPTGNCFYNQSEDPAHDDCVFCHDPSERK